jgi:Flp pilus assembly protein TadG
MVKLVGYLRRSERGQAVVETALVLPIIALLLFGMLDGGRVFHAWIVVTNGAREGARAASARQDTLVVLTAVDDAMGSITTFNVSVNPPDPSDPLGAPSGTPVTVDVDTDVTLVTPLIGALFGGPTVNVNASSTMQLE